jgi:hypothetical protein
MEEVMNRSRDKILFWCLMAAQMAGSQVLIWVGIPVYQRMHSAGGEKVSPQEIGIALAATALMQVAHWLALPLKRRLRFRRNVLLGHVLVMIGEFSLFFSAALATFTLFDRFGELKLGPLKLLTLAAMLFAVSSYKYLLMSLGEAMNEAEPEAPEQTNPSAK